MKGRRNICFNQLFCKPFFPVLSLMFLACGDKNSLVRRWGGATLTLFQGGSRKRAFRKVFLSNGKNKWRDEGGCWETK